MYYAGTDWDTGQRRQSAPVQGRGLRYCFMSTRLVSVFVRVCVCVRECVLCVCECVRVPHRCCNPRIGGHVEQCQATPPIHGVLIDWEHLGSRAVCGVAGSSEQTRHVPWPLCQRGWGCTNQKQE